jgi:hypothetical protein
MIDHVEIAIAPTGHYKNKHDCVEAAGILPHFVMGPADTMAMNMQQNYNFFDRWSPPGEATVTEGVFQYPGDPPPAPNHESNPRCGAGVSLPPRTRSNCGGRCVQPLDEDGLMESPALELKFHNRDCRAKVRRAMKRLVAAAREDEFKGGGDPSMYEEIEMELDAAIKNFNKVLRGVLP